MNAKTIVFLCVFSAYSLATTAQHFSGEVEIKRERTFTGSALYGFMNGGSELFLEYDFQELKVFDAVYRNENYTIEIYRMQSPVDAFGIYSIHTFKCKRTDSLGRYDCLSKHQLQSAMGTDYVSIVFPSGSVAAQQGADQLLPMCSSNNDAVIIPEQFCFVKPPYSGSLKYAKGPLGAFAAKPGLSPLLESIKNYELWYAGQSDKGPCALILLKSKEDYDMLRDKTRPSQIIRQGETFLLINGIEE